MASVLCPMISPEILTIIERGGNLDETVLASVYAHIANCTTCQTRHPKLAERLHGGLRADD